MKKWAVYLSLLLGLSLAFLAAQAPGRIESLYPFDVDRVLKTIAQIAQKPHPLGTPEHDLVRDYILHDFESLGLRVTKSDDVGLRAEHIDNVTIAPVSNIIAILEGEDRLAPAILVMSHYDTVIHSPGAADDSLGVATSLEMARALRSGPKPKRDVIFLVTDGEEAGLVGAQAFFAHHPLKDHVGVVINMEARGDAGRVNMFETGLQNGGLIELYAKVVGTPSANSLSSLIYRLMPNGTDLTQAIKAKKTGLNFAMIGHESAYHTPLSTPDAISHDSVHHMGAQTWPIIKALSQAKTLPEAKPNAIYSDILGKVFVHYDVLMGWFVLAGVALVIIVALISSLKTSPVTLASWIRAKSGGMMILLMPALYLWMIGHVFSAFDHGQKLTHFPFLFGGTVLGLMAVFLVSLQQLLFAKSRKLLVLITILMLGVDLVFGFDGGALAIALCVLLLIMFTGQQTFTGLTIKFKGKPALDINSLWRFILLFNLCLAMLAQAFAPEATPVILWPLCLSAVAALVHFTLCQAKSAIWAQGLYSLMAIFAIGQAGALGVTLYEALGVDMPIVLLLIVLVVSPNIVPLFIAKQPTEDTKPYWELNLAVVAFMVLAYVYLVPPSVKFPQATSVIAVETDGQAYLVSGIDHPDKWVRSILGKDMHHSALAPMGPYPQYWTRIGLSRAQPAQAQMSAQDGVLHFHAVAPKGVKRLSLRLKPDMDIELVSLNGLSLSGTLKASMLGTYQVYLPNDSGIDLVIQARTKGKITLVTQTLSDQWPVAEPLPPMPKAYMASGLHGYGLVYGTQIFEVP